MNLRSRWIKGAAGCLVLFSLVGHFMFRRGAESKYAQQLVAVGSPAVVDAAFDSSKPRCTTSEPRKPPGGFLLALRFWEQQTQAIKTVLQLQCLATHFGMHTVEPFLYKSFLGFPFSNFRTRNDFLNLGDLIDLDLWNRESKEKFDFFPLVSWSNFLQSAPRNVIFLCIKYHNPPQITLPVPGFDYRTGCPSTCFHHLNSSLAVLNQHGNFRVVREACANFIGYGGAVEERSLIENILGGYDYREVTVLMNEFRGFYGLYRMQVLSNCGIDHHKPNITIVPSALIMNDATKYVFDVLHGEPYIAILVRIERVVLHLEHDITECSNRLESLLQTLSQQHKTKKYFLAMDVGKFGSRGSTIHNLTLHGQAVLKSVYGGSVTFAEWEGEIEKYASKVEEAYVANLQRAIAAKARCLVMFGAGGFQAQARDFYVKQHPNRNTWCIHKLCHDHKGAAPNHVQIS